MNKKEFRDSAIEYIKQIYEHNKYQDIEMWEHLLATIMDYIDENIQYYHGDDNETK